MGGFAVGLFEGDGGRKDTLLTVIRIATNVAWCWKINRDKRLGKYAKYEGSGDDRDPSFFMVL